MREAAAPASRATGVLRPWQRRLYRILLIPLGLIAANAIYLYAFTRDTAFFYTMLLLHLTLGVLIAIPFGAASGRALVTRYIFALPSGLTDTCRGLGSLTLRSPPNFAGMTCPISKWK